MSDSKTYEYVIRKSKSKHPKHPGTPYYGEVTANNLAEAKNKVRFKLSCRSELFRVWLKK